MATKEDVLIAIRKIIRATDIHSRQLTKTVGLTAPQLLVLQAIRDLGAVAISRLSAEVSLSQATVTTILDRLESRGYAVRQRNAQDKRVVHALLTDAGRQAINRAPVPLQEAFSVRFEQLPDAEQAVILSALQRVAAMMGAQDLDASPFLTLGELTEDGLAASAGGRAPAAGQAPDKAQAPAGARSPDKATPRRRGGGSRDS